MDLGLLARAVEFDALDEAVEAEVLPYLSCASGAVAAAKKMARDLGLRIDDAAVQHIIDALSSCWHAEETGAFLD